MPRFFPTDMPPMKKRLFDLCKSQWTRGETLSPMPEGFSYPREKRSIDPKLPKVQWINHCTFFIKWCGVNFLTDPIFSKRCSPLSFMGPKRQHLPGASIKDLNVDVVLISHNHYDHLDKKAVEQLIKSHTHIDWLVPFGMKKWFLKRGAQKVQELKWWESFSIEMKGRSFSFHFVPAQHFSGRGIFDWNKTLWGGWVVEENERRFYFVGDTGYNNTYFKEIGEKFKRMDLSLIPIGTYKPKSFMQPIHVSPEEAVLIHEEVGSHLSVGMHWKTFRLSSEGLDRPPYDLFRALERKGLSPLDFLPLKPGETINW